MKNKRLSPSKRRKKPGIKSICFVVQGQVRASDGGPEPGLTVTAFDRDVGRNDTLLGRAMTDGNGRYSISYAPEQLGGKPAADLLVGVYKDETLLQSSDVIFNARPVETHDFIIRSTPAPDFQHIPDKIRPLQGTKVGLDGLEKNGIDFLDRKTCK
jgi:hypothetical protein